MVCHEILVVHTCFRQTKVNNKVDYKSQLSNLSVFLTAKRYAYHSNLVFADVWSDNLTIRDVKNQVKIGITEWKRKTATQAFTQNNSFLLYYFAFKNMCHRF